MCCSFWVDVYITSHGTLVNDKLVVDIPHAVSAVAGFQSLASITLVFLIGLALRNRFRI